MRDDPRLVFLTIVLAVAIAAQGCRCESGQPSAGTAGQGGEVQAGAEQAGGEGDVARWCMACAQKGFMACKRTDGRKPEADLKREAELLACKDVGIAEADCTPDKLSNVSCGVMP